MENPIPAVDREAVRAYLRVESATWGHNVHARRKAAGLTLEQVATLADTTPQTVHKVERGQITPRDDLRLALALALFCEVADLFPTPTRGGFIKAAS
jgi:transcriptional regulator with XRE-family HTH domain